MISTYANQNSDWFGRVDNLAQIVDMESEIAELLTLTKVTRLRKQIECKEEGAWMVVKDIPDENAPSGTRKVTSYGMTKRSVTRSVSSNIDLDNIFNSKITSEPLVQLPEESEQYSKPSTVEITEVFDEPLRRDFPVVKHPEKFMNKKTSVVTLGKGNLVLIDPEDDDANFHVTGISKGKVADAVNTLEKTSDKKIKKVGFCKTEVHFAPDSGKINIVETDEKPPPTQVYRKKKRSRGSKSPSRGNSCLPKHYFGDDIGEDANLSNESDKEEHKKLSYVPPETIVISDVREKLPTFERTIKSEGKDSKYRHSSPDKNNLDIEKVKAEGKEFFKKLKVPSFREKFLKESSHVPEKLYDSNMDDIIKNIDKSPRLKDTLYLYEDCNYTKDKELLKSKCKLNNDDSVSSYLSKISSNTSPNQGKKGADNSDGTKHSEESGKNLRYVELFKLPSSPENENVIKKSVKDEKTIIETEKIPTLKSNDVSDNNHSKLRRDSISERLLDITRIPLIPVDQPISFLGNVSPKLQNLIQNSVEHEFQLRQKQILQKKSLERKSSEKKTQTNHSGNDKVISSITVNLTSAISGVENEAKFKQPKNVTHVRLGPETESKHEFQLKREEITKSMLSNDPINVSNKDKPKETLFLLNQEPVPAPRAKKEVPINKDVSKSPPKPKPRTISVALDKSKGPKSPTARVTSRIDSSKRVKSRESLPRSKDTERNYSRTTIIKDEGKSKKLQNQTQRSEGTTHRVSRVASTEIKGKKASSREPLRSFEKVSNGWVGHISPAVKQGGITVTTKVLSSKTAVQGHHNTGPRRSTQTSSSVRTSQSHSTRLDSGRSTKQFSLSKEHLSSAKLVKEVRRTSTSKRLAGKMDRDGRQPDSYRSRARHESERSDDSVVQADEEVRAEEMSRDMDEMTASYSEICECDSEEKCDEVGSSGAGRPSQLELLNRLDGTVSKDGDMITFVADDLETKLRLASPRGILAALESEACAVAASVDSLIESLSDNLHGISTLTVDCLEVYTGVVCKTCDSLDANIKAMYQLMAKCEELSKAMAPIYQLSANVKNIKHLLDLIEASPA